MKERIRTELEAAAFRRLLEHLRERSDVQNIELMELAGFRLESVRRSGKHSRKQGK